MELYKKYRPKTLDEVIGQDRAVKDLKNLISRDKVPHSILFFGPSGCGKSTLAKILAKEVGCTSGLHEINCASIKEPLDAVRSIEIRMGYSPLSGGKNVWLLDEYQSLSRSKGAQQALLMMLENPPNKTYFFLCTTDSDKIIPAIRNRCVKIKVDSIKPKDILSILKNTCNKEGVSNVTEDTLDKIVEIAEGSARDALNALEKVIGLSTEEEQIDAVYKSSDKHQAKSIAQLLLNSRTQWGEIAKSLKDLDNDPEGLRHQILGYATNALLRGGKDAGRAYYIISAFEGNFYDSKRAGLARACWEVMHNAPPPNK